ncbi:MAG: M42 family metallopeptidase [Gemmatimonadetes bacterium]|nr:M42 family metallopeptidase [Gemmatimonadota bacterium]NNM06770.1 M42 family metallopeptidase [Gemmatimonadota bacterium]
MSDRIDFLEKLLNAPGPSGFEVNPARVWREEAETFADRVWTDVTGNSIAGLNPEGSPRVMLAGHIDEIGLQVTHIDDAGFLFFDEIGGWDSQVLVGQRVKVLAGPGTIPGVIGKKPIHLLKKEEQAKATKTKDLWVDLGCTSAEEVGDLGVRVGDPMVLDAGLVQLAGDRIASRAIDNRIGAYVVLEALRLLSAEPPQAATMAVATVQEEIAYTGGGARSSAFALEPDVALVVDVTFSTDVPDIEKKELGEHKIGGGPVLSRGSAAHPVVFSRLVEAAEAEGVDFTIQAAPKATRTDADGIHLVRMGVPTGLVSVPNRYMHSPNEVVSLGDLQSTAQLLAAFIRRLGPDTDFTPH